MNFLNQNKKLPASLTIPKPIIYISKIVQMFSTKLVALLGAKLFVTPFSFTTPKRERTMEKSAQKKNIHIKDINKSIHVLSYGYSKKKVLLVHGWAGRSTQLFAFADKLLENGYMVISFDGPAHGKSSGKTTNLPDYLETITQINIEFGPFEAAIGHSFGGISLYNSAANDLQLKSLVTIGAADKVSDIIKGFTNNLQVKPIVAKKMKTYFDKQWELDVDSFSSGKKARKIKTPTLVVHDSKDGDVPVSCAHAIRQNLENGQLLITHGLGHTKILRNQKVVNRVVAFIKQNE